MPMSPSAEKVSTSKPEYVEATPRVWFVACVPVLSINTSLKNEIKGVYRETRDRDHVRELLALNGRTITVGEGEVFVQVACRATLARVEYGMALTALVAVRAWEEQI